MSEILCIGSVLWDIIGRAPSHMRQGSDVPGRITRLPGGVALNIAMTLARFGQRPVLLSAVGRDAEGEELVAACEGLGMETAHLYRSDDLPTDVYMAVEGANGLIAAIADAHSLEAAGDKILRPLTHGPLGTAAQPYDGIVALDAVSDPYNALSIVALDGNLTRALLETIATSPAFARADLRVAPASPGKAERLQPFMNHNRATLYVNLEEAGILCQTDFADTESAAAGLLERGARRVLVTDGGQSATEADAAASHTQAPPKVLVTRVTGAGDTFMAAHITAERGGAEREAALTRALQAAARYVSGEMPS